MELAIMEQHVYYYWEADLVCFLFIVVMFYKIAAGPDQSIKARAHLWVIVSMMVFLCSDFLWVFADAGGFSDYPVLFLGANLFNYLSMAACGYIFSIFTAVYLDSEWVKKKKNRILAAVPMIFNMFLITLSVENDLYFQVENGRLIPHPLFSVMVLLIFIYLIVPFFIVSVKYKKDEYGFHHSEYRAIMIYPLILIITGFLQVIWWKMPILCYGVVAANGYMYVNFTNELVSKDPLTDTNNRREIRRYLYKTISNYSEDQRLFLVLIDIDHFKLINDKFGHAEGDRALCFVAEALKKTCYEAGSHYFIGRYGGDEFMIVARPSSSEELESFKQALKNEVEETRKINNLPYNLSISVGSAEYQINAPESSAEDLLRNADADMYRDKRKRRESDER